MATNTNHRPRMKRRAPALAMLAALRWVALIFGCSRRERAHRFLAILLPPKTHRDGDDSRDLS
jgi:hypothetical protein